MNFQRPAILITTLAFLLITGIACDKDKPGPGGSNDPVAQLPPATQTGENTFGCLWNGRVWLPRRKSTFGQSPLQPSYYNHSFSLPATDLITWEKIVIYFACCLELPRKYALGSDSAFAVVYTDNFSSSYITDITCGSWIDFSRLDTVNRIVAGTFFVTAINQEDATDTIRLTQGRFDVKY